MTQGPDKSLDNASEQANQSRAGKGGVVPPVEHRWQPGKSANPGGRPGYRGVSVAMRRLLRAGPDALDRAIKEPRNNAEALAAAVILNSQSEQSGSGHLKQLLDRVEGPVEQRVHNTGEAAPAFIVEIVGREEGQKPSDP
jgi:hypothetical protein